MMNTFEVARMPLALKRLCQWKIINMDETTWKVAENHAYTASTRGIEKVKALFSGPAKYA
jgi:hypothetical protein